MAEEEKKKKETKAATPYFPDLTADIEEKKLAVKVLSNYIGKE